MSGITKRFMPGWGWLMRRLLCIIGIHDWHISEEQEIAGSDSTDDVSPVDWEVGGVDYHLVCPRCGKFDVIRKRGIWIAPKYPALPSR